MLSVLKKDFLRGKLDKIHVISLEEEMDDYDFYANACDWEVTITGTGFRATKKTEYYTYVIVYEIITLSIERVAVAIDQLNKLDRE